MWLLKKHPPSNDGSDELQYYLLDGRSYVIGRKDCEIVLAGDASISRKHAIITLNKNDDENPSTITITDLSKIGVHVNGGKISSQTETALHNGNVLSFGRLQYKFKLEYYHLVVVTSCINNSNTKNSVKRYVQLLGGHMKSDWESEATHLVMEKLTFTIKVVCAIACGKAIVTPKFLEDMVDCCDKKKGHELPSEQNYLPPVAEQSLLNQEQLFCPNAHRRSLLVGKMFISLAPKQYKRMKQAVECSGGQITLKNEKDTKLLRDLSSNQTIILQAETKDELSSTSTQKAWTREVYGKVKSNNLRLIRESEIGLAILHVSIENFCNPTTSSAPSLTGTTHTQALTDTMIDTQQLRELTVDLQENNTSDVKSQDSDMKRKRMEIMSNSSEDETVFKKPKLDNTSNSVRNTNINNTVSNTNITKTVSSTKRCKDIVEIDDEDDFNFKFIEPSSIQQSENVVPSKNNIVNRNKAISDNIISENETNIDNSNSEKKFDILEDESPVFARNTNIVTPKANGSNLLFTPLSKKAVPDTYPSTEQKKYFDDDEDDPFSFDIPDLTGLENIPDIVQNVIGCSQGESMQIKDKIGFAKSQEKTNERFSKAVASSQESNSENILISDDEGNLISKDKLHNRLKQIDGIQMSPKDTRKSKTSQNKHESVSHLLKDDEEINMVSEEFPVIKQEKAKCFVKLEGFISTVNKKSTAIPKEDPDLDGIDRNLVNTEFADLVVKTAKRKQIISALKSYDFTKLAKNYKTFKKQYYAGKDNTRRPVISDFVVFESDNEEKAHLFADLREENEREEHESRKMDQLFEFGEQKTKKRSAR